MKRVSKLTTLALALVMVLVLVACGGNASGPASSSEGGGSASASTSQTSAATGELAGKPWVTSVIAGNLPAEQPQAKDDLYTHYNYDYLAAHQLTGGDAMKSYAGELKTTNLAVIKDTSKSSHDLDQLRILYNQAADVERLQETGLAEVQPYLDRIDAVTSLDEMNALLSADDFPFSPFVLACVTLSDTRDVNIVTVAANFALVDTIAEGGVYYQDSDDPQVQESMMNALKSSATISLVDLMAMGMSQDSLKGTFNEVAEFEKTHGKYVGYNGQYTQQNFGAIAEDMRKNSFTLDELCAACPNFPMKETLDKMGKGASPRYIATREWLEAFNGVWTSENLEVIKLIAKMKVLGETRPYRDPSVLNKVLQEAGQPAIDAETFAYQACDQQNTFAIVLAQTYVDTALGPNAKSRLTELSQQLIDTYKTLVNNTSWIGEESRGRVVEKLDHLTLNVLEPTGGYYDFSGVELTPTDQGGTLLGNYLKLKQHRLDQESKMVGQPAVAACPWFMIKPTETNAFYDAMSNSINIYPGFVTSLIYADDMSDLELLAGAGFAIGHEISHSFDYLGAQLDAYGTPNPVFSDADVDAFVLKCSTLALYYNGIEVAPGVTVNGELVIAEAAADLCGMQAILELASKVQGVDYDKFFASASSKWAQVVPADALSSKLLGVHPLSNLCINVSAQMFDPIYEALGVSEGDTMYLDSNKRINIWGPKA